MTGKSLRVYFVCMIAIGVLAIVAVIYNPNTAAFNIPILVLSVVASVLSIYWFRHEKDPPRVGGS